MAFDGSKYKAGDQVIVHRGVYGPKLAKVERKTPTGVLVVDGVSYNPDGRMRGASRYSRNSLADRDPETAERVARESLVRAIDSAVYSRKRDTDGWADLATDQLRTLAEMLAVPTKGEQ